MASHEIAEMFIEELRSIVSQVRDETKKDSVIVSLKEMVNEAVKRICYSRAKDVIKAMKEIVVAVFKWFLSCLKRFANFVNESWRWMKTRFSDDLPASVKEEIGDLKKRIDASDESIRKLLSTPTPKKLISFLPYLKLVSFQLKKFAGILTRFRDVMSEYIPMGFLTDALVVVEFVGKIYPFIVSCVSSFIKKFQE